MDELDRLMHAHKQLREAYDSLYEDLARIRDHGIFPQARTAARSALRKHDAQYRALQRGG